MTELRGTSFKFPKDFIERFKVAVALERTNMSATILALVKGWIEDVEEENGLKVQGWRT